MKTQRYVNEAQAFDGARIGEPLAPPSAAVMERAAFRTNSVTGARNTQKLGVRYVEEFRTALAEVAAAWRARRDSRLPSPASALSPAATGRGSPNGLPCLPRSELLLGHQRQVVRGEPTIPRKGNDLLCARIEGMTRVYEGRCQYKSVAGKHDLVLQPLEQ